jgi:ABC-2 type transport system ATP-binding protein
MDKAIEAEGLVKVYGRDVRALDGLDLEVPAGTIFGLLGPNGAGKSTAVRILSTLARPDAGSARVGGRDVLRDPAAVRRSIGVVAQSSGLDEYLTGRENLRLQGRLQGLRGSDLEQRVDSLLDSMRLTEAADRVTHGYSGGMQRRLDIALGLVHRPRVLFLDEPTTGLDPEIRAEMWELIEGLRREEGLTILLTTHYLEEADQLAGSLAIMDRGKVVATGSPEELKAGLHGDAVHVQLAEGAPSDVNGALAGVAGVREVVMDGRSLHARVDDGARAVPAVLGAFAARSIPVATVTVARPSLDDVYLRHAGRSFARADAQPEEGTR